MLARSSEAHMDFILDCPDCCFITDRDVPTCANVVLRVGIYHVDSHYSGHFVSGWSIMPKARESGDLALVRACLSGSEQAWGDFYCRYVGLIRSVVKRHAPWVPTWEMEDISQSVFAALVPALGKYDDAYSLSRFVCVIAERVCIQEYRQTRAAKRTGQTEPVDHHDGEEGGRTLRSPEPSQEDLLAQHQIRDAVTQALERLESRCRELLKLRYVDELSYKQISKILGASENTLTVRARRCLSELSAVCRQELTRKVTPL